MTQQGTEAHWLYIMRTGIAEVRVVVDGGKLTRKVATLKSGDFFGEMGLMTGEPHTATVIAETGVDCYRLDKAAFHDVLHQRPQLAEDISLVLARRRVELEAAREGLNEAAKNQRMQHAQGDLLDSIKSFFTL